ncbi:histidinol dehydrogenase [Ferroglobus sp.]|uniref:histidinol dehydrogenase n=1 Tax=Ferroglobus sp. TaxID=2614230 RepID=UPI0025C03E63|nr:histidinol dehydrogenase [Ferroglobus sp.]
MLEKVLEEVKQIIEKVKREGDKALYELTEKFDKVKLDYIKVPKEKIDEAYEKVSDDLIDALEMAKENIEKFHQATSPESIRVDYGDAILGKIYVPIEKAGLYIPGGRASYPSTALMTAIPAKIAGVDKVVACTPPVKDGVNPLTLVALDLADVDEIYAVGGAQAIAAMAYGTESVEKVDKIVGPGNIYVTAAKLLVQKDVAIDMPAGPSEILIIADETANSDFIAYDCAAQLEHDPLAKAILVTISERIAEDVKRKVSELVSQGEFKIILVKDLDEAFEIANKIAPEHLSVFTKNALKMLGKVRNAGSVFLGEYSPVAAGDYASGTNHVLPTGGYARVYSGLSTETFMKHITYQMLSKEWLEKYGDVIIKIAKAEGLPLHAKSVEERLK